MEGSLERHCEREREMSWMELSRWKAVERAERRARCVAAAVEHNLCRSPICRLSSSSVVYRFGVSAQFIVTARLLLRSNERIEFLFACAVRWTCCCGCCCVLLSITLISITLLQLLVPHHRQPAASGSIDCSAFESRCR